MRERQQLEQAPIMLKAIMIKTSITTLTALLKYKMSYRLEMPEINGCDFSISYL